MHSGDQQLAADDAGDTAFSNRAGGSEAHIPDTDVPDIGRVGFVPDEIKLILQQRRERPVEVRQPLALITQVPRSGGTLMARLLDGHQNCHTMTQELYIRWPELDRMDSDTDELWDAVGGTKLQGFLKRGMKPGRGRARTLKERHPFLTPPSFARALFHDQLADEPDPDRRAILDAYFFAYFNAWLDNRNLYGKKRWVTGFQPRTITKPRALRHYWRAYPKGRIISIARDPAGWFASAQGWSAEWKSIEVAIDAWKESAEAALRVARGHSEQVLLLTFDELVSDTAATMKRVSAFLGIPFSKAMLTPTFNGIPIGANSSFKARDARVSREVLSHHRDVLSSEDYEFIDLHATAIYEEFVSAASRPVNGSNAKGDRNR